MTADTDLPRRVPGAALAGARAEDAAAVFRENLGRLRGGRGWTQRALARKAGISADMVSRIECGKSGPGLMTALRLAGALGAMLGEAAYGESGGKNGGGS